ncbi:MAG: hypothetical protein JST52_09060 [Bacteroidetes bacterium]|nr:hypothetical protein [Bacteroidota bacterium]
MKRLFIFTLVLATLATGCNKESSKNNNLIGNGNWTLGGVTYTAKSSQRESVIGTDKSISFSDGTTNVASFSFTSYPTGNSTYSLSKVGILAGNKSKVYGVTKPEANTGKVVTVTISNAKATISAANIWLFNTSNVNDSMLFSATVTEF